MKDQKKIWFDITNTPHVNFFKPIVHDLKNDFQLIYSVRDFAEVYKLFKKYYDVEPITIGGYWGKHISAKLLGSLFRMAKLMVRIPNFDIKISVGGHEASIIAKLRKKKSIIFDDNEIAPNWRFSPFTDFAFYPKAIPLEIILGQGFKKDKLYQYNGFKEQIYIAGYKPDITFKEKIPFEEYIILRPENLKSNYVEKGKVSIVPKLSSRTC